MNLQFLKFNLKAMNLEYIGYIYYIYNILRNSDTHMLAYNTIIISLLFVLLSIHIVCIICIIIYFYLHYSM